MKNEEKKTIRRIDVLREMELREDINQARKYYSIQFWTKEGELRYFPRAYTCGLKCNVKRNRVRGVQQVDLAGNPINHITTISIDNIREFNHQRVLL